MDAQRVGSAPASAAASASSSAPDAIGSTAPASVSTPKAEFTADPADVAPDPSAIPDIPATPMTLATPSAPPPTSQQTPRPQDPKPFSILPIITALTAGLLMGSFMTHLVYAHGDRRRVAIFSGRDGDYIKQPLTSQA
jgi:hypothetical protein